MKSHSCPYALFSIIPPQAVTIMLSVLVIKVLYLDVLVSICCLPFSKRLNPRSFFCCHFFTILFAKSVLFLLAALSFLPYALPFCFAMSRPFLFAVTVSCSREHGLPCPSEACPLEQPRVYLCPSHVLVSPVSGWLQSIPIVCLSQPWWFTWLHGVTTPLPSSLLHRTLDTSSNVF